MMDDNAGISMDFISPNLTPDEQNKSRQVGQKTGSGCGRLFCDSLEEEGIRYIQIITHSQITTLGGDKDKPKHRLVFKSTAEEFLKWPVDYIIQQFKATQA
jgi:hypothetical protein